MLANSGRGKALSFSPSGAARNVDARTGALRDRLTGAAIAIGARADAAQPEDYSEDAHEFYSSI
jgi:hypothetical protein